MVIYVDPSSKGMRAFLHGQLGPRHPVLALAVSTDGNTVTFWRTESRVRRNTGSPTRAG